MHLKRKNLCNHSKSETVLSIFSVIQVSEEEWERVVQLPKAFRVDSYGRNEKIAQNVARAVKGAPDACNNKDMLEWAGTDIRWSFIWDKHIIHVHSRPTVYISRLRYQHLCLSINHCLLLTINEYLLNLQVAVGSMKPRFIRVIKSM